MKKILFISLLFISAIANAQKCEYEKNEIDRFSGNKTIKTEIKIIAEDIRLKDLDMAIRDIGFYGLKNNNVYSLRISIKYYNFFTSPNKANLGNASTLIFLLEDNSQIEITFTSSSEDIIYENMDPIQEKDVVINADQYKLLSNAKVVAIKVNAQIRPFDFNITPENQNVIADLLKCIE